jgi:hypothetical protein
LELGYKDALAATETFSSYNLLQSEKALLTRGAVLVASSGQDPVDSNRALSLWERHGYGGKGGLDSVSVIGSYLGFAKGAGCGGRHFKSVSHIFIGTR